MSVGAQEVKQIAMFIAAAGEILFLFSLASDVNRELERKGKQPLTRREYGWRFFDQVLKQHERLFPESQKRTLWILTFILLIIGFIIADIFY